ncbi:sensor histidine kinase [Salipaludibacillus agaradhaerens]|uniref:sensor histidine kinase n=1 Tax=Salipaludibacillus agaradhaerens TaxID=76935 RepID=UPI002151FC0A|nr:sensor histidine kinase [Salipaludibacillus agaradhaerens]MCR6108386.1 sensor histidine kinase [Salipaludibacillus agaradhaerens]MCR6120409.1 sensor histidine kinase [Salipaludibacillus agaradhaerens]UJW59418.1 sensor histidine kinase [Bacillus sp. A116_S68]
MKLFLKEHSLLIVIQIIQLSGVIGVLWLDGYRDLKLSVYAIFLGLVVLTGYLAYHYISHRHFYARLSNPLMSLDDSYQKTEAVPMAKALDQLLKAQYKHYHKQIKTLEKQQEEHLTFIDQWVHQMKTPLSVIDLTARNVEEPESSDIRAETDRMKNGLNTVLYMARLRTLEQDFHFKPVSLSTLVKEVNHENKRFYIRHNVYPEVRQQSPHITVETDEKWLMFIISQLVNNAVKYSTGIASKMTIAVYEKNREAILEVTDFGVGIPTQDMKRVFNAFYTGENGRTFRESTGMGLYLVKEVLDQLGHRIELESKEGEGSTFRIIFTSAQNLTSV